MNKKSANFLGTQPAPDVQTTGFKNLMKNIRPKSRHRSGVFSKEGVFKKNLKKFFKSQLLLAFDLLS